MACTLVIPGPCCLATAIRFAGRPDGNHLESVSFIDKNHKTIFPAGSTL